MAPESVHQLWRRGRWRPSVASGAVLEPMSYVDPLGADNRKDLGVALGLSFLVELGKEPVLRSEKERGWVPGRATTGKGGGGSHEQEAFRAGQVRPGASPQPTRDREEIPTGGQVEPSPRRCVWRPCLVPFPMFLYFSVGPC